MVPFESPSRVDRRAAKIWEGLQTPALIEFVIRSVTGAFTMRDRR